MRDCVQTTAPDDISVSELCRAAQIQRTSFYTHFASVSELLTSMLVDAVEEPLHAPDMTGLSIAQVAAEFQQTLVSAYEVATRDRELFRAGFLSDGSALLRRALTEMFTRRLYVALEIWGSLGVTGGVDTDVAVPFAAGGLTASMEAWVMNDGDDPVRWAESVRDQMPPWWPRAG